MVLLCAYFNFGMCQLKAGTRSSEITKSPIKARRTLDEASQTFAHASKIANRYLGCHHYFSQKLIRKVQTCQTLIKQSKSLANQTYSSYAPSASSNVAGFVAQKKSILRQH